MTKAFLNMKLCIICQFLGLKPIKFSMVGCFVNHEIHNHNACFINHYLIELAITLKTLVVSKIRTRCSKFNSHTC